MSRFHGFMNIFKKSIPHSYLKQFDTFFVIQCYYNEWSNPPSPSITILIKRCCEKYDLNLSQVQLSLTPRVLNIWNVSNCWYIKTTEKITSAWNTCSINEFITNNKTTKPDNSLTFRVFQKKINSSIYYLHSTVNLPNIITMQNSTIIVTILIFNDSLADVITPEESNESVRHVVEAFRYGLVILQFTLHIMTNLLMWF